MRTRIFFNHQTGERTELSEDEYWRIRTRQDAPNVMPDLDSAYGGGFTSPINGEHITSRSQLRAHEQRYNVKQCGDYKPGEVVASQKAVVERRNQELRSLEQAFARGRRGRGVDFKWQ